MNETTVVLKPRLHKVAIFLGSLVVSVGILTFQIVMLLFSPDKSLDTSMIFLFILIIIAFGMPSYLTITYFATDLTKRVTIDQVSNRIIIRKNKTETIITEKDVVDSFYVRVGEFPNSKFRFPSYSYIMLILKERERVCITSLLCEPVNILGVLNLKPRDIETNIPLIDWKLGSAILTSKEFDKKVKEFEHYFKEKTNLELAKIMGDKKTFADYAREAASRILNSRKNSDS